MQTKEAVRRPSLTSLPPEIKLMDDNELRALITGELVQIRTTTGQLVIGQLVRPRTKRRPSAQMDYTTQTCTPMLTLRNSIAYANRSDEQEQWQNRDKDSGRDSGSGTDSDGNKGGDGDNDGGRDRSKSRAGNGNEDGDSDGSRENENENTITVSKKSVESEGGNLLYVKYVCVCVFMCVGVCVRVRACVPVLVRTSQSLLSLSFSPFLSRRLRYFLLKLRNIFRTKNAIPPS